MGWAWPRGRWEGLPREGVQAAAWAAWRKRRAITERRTGERLLPSWRGAMARRLAKPACTSMMVPRWAWKR